MVSITEVSLEEVSPALRLNSRGSLQTSVSFPLKWEGMKMVGFQWRETFPFDPPGPIPSWVFSERTPLPGWNPPGQEQTLSSI